jgi:diguanylate cyclase (GGDEF)-like protein
MKQPSRDITTDSPGTECSLLERITPLARRINCLDIGRIADVCVNNVPQLVGMQYGSLYVLDETNRMLHLSRNSHPYEINKLVSLNQTPPTAMTVAVKSNEVIIVDDTELHQTPVMPRYQRGFSKNYKSKNCVIVPLVCQDRVVGALNLSGKQGSLSQEDLSLIELFGQLAGASIGNIKLFERMQRQATTDGLTGFVNHRSFYELLEKELWRSRRYGSTISLMMVDVDNLKGVNDTLGHRAGDKMIQEICTRIKQCTRQIDIVARYGGDEFAIILPNTSTADAVTVGQRMVQVVSSRPAIFQGQKIPLSVSIGVAEYDSNCNPEEVANRADKALYHAKESGKNTVVVFEA